MMILSPRWRAVAHRFVLTTLPLCAMLAAFGVPGAAFAAVQLRVDARPTGDPIEAFVRVTDANGVRVEDLTAGDFTVTIDGDPVTIGGVTQPSGEDPNQRVSVVFAMDYSQSVQTVALAAMQQAVIDFVGTMADGDVAAIVKFNDSNPARASVVLPFTVVDQGVNNQLFVDAVGAPYDGDGTNLLDALELSVNHFLSSPVTLPDGPKAVIVISDGGENQSEISESDVIALANANNLPIFTIGVGNIGPIRRELLSGLASDTGGQYLETTTAEEIADAYATISQLLSQEYLITIPSGITDCAEHTLVVNVAGPAPGTATATFTRRACDSEPDAFSFASQADVAPSTNVTSNTETIMGLEVAAHISVINGSYSIGCDGTFTGDPATIANGETVCVRHVAAGGFSTAKTSTLTIGGIAATFTSTTLADSGGGGGGGGGGGLTGLFELLLLGFSAFIAGRRRLA